MKLLLLVNSAASSVTPRGKIVIQKALSADHDLTVAETSRRGHATKLAQGAAATGTDVVVVLGGDGTLNEAANGLAGTEAALAPLPGGSTNVFARTIGMPDDPVESTGVLLDALEANSIQRVGLGTVNDRYFLFHVGIGFDAAVVEQVEKRGDLKRYAGHPLFIYSTFSTWFAHFDRKNPHFGASVGGKSVYEDGYFAVCCNTNPYTYLGSQPFDIAPEATLDRGLALATFRTLRASKLIRVASKALRGGGIKSSRGFDYRYDLDAFEINAHGEVPYQVDGDFLGRIDRLVFRHEPDVMKLVMPVS